MKKSIYSILILCFVSSVSQAQGKFEGEVVVKWVVENGPDRRMELVEPVSFTDQRGVVWSVPAGAVIDGASIPSLFWNTIGPPFVGDYRRASVIHDYYCNVKSRPWRDVHRMFYHACIAGGVTKLKAIPMYGAVYSGGPRWELVQASSQKGLLPSPFSITAFNEMKVYYPVPDLDRFKECETWFHDDDLSLEELEARLEEEQVFTVEEVSSGITM